jgi:hypothetical protein
MNQGSFAAPSPSLRAAQDDGTERCDGVHAWRVKEEADDLTMVVVSIR